MSKAAEDKTTIKALRRKLNTALALILDARNLVGPWPEELAKEADRMTRDYEQRKGR